MQIICLIGPPCVGKGTQAKLLQQSGNFTIIGAGNLLREAARTDSECALLVNSGQLVPSMYVWNLIEKKIIHTQTLSKYIILDGYPRKIEQAELIKKFIEKNNFQLHLICMSTSIQRLVERMHDRVYCPVCDSTNSGENIICCNRPMIKRADDHDQAFDSRVNIFTQSIENIKLFFQNVPNCTWHEFYIEDETIEQVDKRFYTLIKHIQEHHLF